MRRGLASGSTCTLVPILILSVPAQCFLECDFSEALRGFPARMVRRAVLPARGVGEQAALVLEMPHKRGPVGLLGRRIGFGDETGATEINGRLPGMSGVGPG